MRRKVISDCCRTLASGGGEAKAFACLAAADCFAYIQIYTHNRIVVFNTRLAVAGGPADLRIVSIIRVIL